MSTEHRALRVSVRALEGVASVAVSREPGLGRVAFDPRRLTAATIVNAIARLGYAADERVAGQHALVAPLLGLGAPAVALLGVMTTACRVECTASVDRGRRGRQAEEKLP